MQRNESPILTLPELVWPPWMPIKWEGKGECIQFILWIRRKTLPSEMNKISLVLAVVLFFTPPLYPKLEAQKDKGQHFGFSLLFGAIGESFFHYSTDWKDISLIGWGAAVGTLPGLAKEILDSMEENNHFSGLDLAADFAGAFCGALLGNLFNNMIEIDIRTESDKHLFAVSLRITF